MTELSIIHEIAETVSQYEEELLYDVESNHHEIHIRVWWYIWKYVSKH